MMMDTFQTLGDNDDVDHSDGDSERNIVKATVYTVTTTPTGTSSRDDELVRDQVLGWERKNISHVERPGR
jgi:hypothetical protein